MAWNVRWLILLLAGCAARVPPPAPVSGGEGAALGSAAILSEAIQQVQEGDCPGAILVAQRGLANRPTSSETLEVVSTRGVGVAAALLALTHPVALENRAGMVTLVSSDWPDLAYIEGYCLVEAHRLDEAQAAFAIGLSYLPGDAVISSELGNIFQERKDWQSAYAVFSEAYANVAVLERTPGFEAQADGSRALLWGQPLSGWRRRALRGQAFSLVELRRFDEAEAAYREVLSIDPTDAQAKKELEFIAEVRSRSVGNSTGGSPAPSR